MTEAAEATPTTFRQLTKAQQQRAFRLLMRAEADDSTKQEAKAREQEQDRIRVEREAVKEELAENWRQRFSALGLAVTVGVETTFWDNDGAHPEVWVALGEGRHSRYSHTPEGAWAMLLDRLEATRPTGSGQD